MEFLTGAMVSIIVQLIKKYFGTTTIGTYIAVAVVSVLAGALYWWLMTAGYWESTLQILVAAGAVHNFLLRPLEK